MTVSPYGSHLPTGFFAAVGPRGEENQARPLSSFPNQGGMAACAFLFSCHDFSAQILELSALAGLEGVLTHIASPHHREV